MRPAALACNCSVSAKKHEENNQNVTSLAHLLQARALHLLVLLATVHSHALHEQLLLGNLDGSQIFEA